MAYSSDPRRNRLARRGSRLRRPPPGLLRPAPARTSNLPAMLGRGLLALLLLAGLALLGSAGAAYGGYTQLTSSLTPRLDEIQRRDSFQTSRIYDRNGTLLYEFFGAGKRTRVPLQDISPVLINATIAIEDKTFFENKGVDYAGIAAALVRSLEAGEETGGASTITQQLVRGVILTDEEKAPEKRYQRKVTEIVLAQELTERYSKEQILELYLNEIYYGNLAYGIEAAADVYFNVSAEDLTLPQASLLAGLPQLPSLYDPMNYLEGDTLKGVRLGDGWYRNDYALPADITTPKARQIAVLSQMVDEGYITEAQGRAAAAADLAFAPQEVPLNAPHFVFYVRKLLEEQYGQQFVNQGLSIYTSLDLNMQRMVQEKAAERIAELEERNIHNAAVVVMQPNTGQVLAMVGSIDYNRTVPSTTPGETKNVLDGQVNVTIRERQPGSALKPFTYLSAMERGATPATVWWDVKTEFTAGPEPYAPENYNGRWNGPLHIRTALANSLNMPAVKALKFAGIQNTIDLLHRTGVTGLQRSADYYGLALTLGGGEVTPLDLTTAYNTLASGGRYYPPAPILKIVDGEGTVLQEFVPPEPIPLEGSFNPDTVAVPPRPGEQVLNPDHVAIVTDMMSDDQARAPIWGLNSKLNLSRPAAVKTGTTNDWRDAWAVGFTPSVTVGVWTGNNNNEATAKVESLTGGGIIWHNVMETLFATPEYEQILAEPYGGTPPREFALPGTVVRKPICRLPGPFNNFRDELFAPDMLTAEGRIKDGNGTLGCEVVSSVTVADLGEEGGGYCRPVDGVAVPPELLTTVEVWRTPPADPDEKVTYTWNGGGVGGANNINDCSSDMIAAIAPPGAIRMPNLRGFGENQAKEQLAALGVADRIFVQYQGREQIGDVFDQFPAYAVVSTIPRAGEWIKPEDYIFLGIRAPDSQPAPPAEPPPAEPPPAEPPPAEPPPAEPPPQP